MLPVLPGPALVTWPVVPPVVPVVEPLSVAEDEAVALLVTGVPPLVPLVLEVLALVPLVLELVLLVSAAFEVGPPADVGPPLSSELQPTFQPTRAKTAAGTTRRGAWARCHGLTRFVLRDFVPESTAISFIIIGICVPLTGIPPRGSVSPPSPGSFCGRRTSPSSRGRPLWCCHNIVLTLKEHADKAATHRDRRFRADPDVLEAARSA